MLNESEEACWRSHLCSTLDVISLLYDVEKTEMIEFLGILFIEGCICDNYGQEKMRAILTEMFHQFIAGNDSEGGNG